MLFRDGDNDGYWLSPGNPGQPDIALIVLIPTRTGRLRTNEKKVNDVIFYKI